MHFIYINKFTCVLHLDGVGATSGDEVVVVVLLVMVVVVVVLVVVFVVVVEYSFWCSGCDPFY